MNLLFIIGTYLPTPSANGIVCKNLVEEMNILGHVADVLCEKNNDSIEISNVNGNIYTIDPPFSIKLIHYSKLIHNKFYCKFLYYFGLYLNRISRYTFMLFRPFNSFLYPFAISKRISKLNAVRHYDVVITIYQPFNPLLALYFNKRFSKSNFKWIVISLDPFTVTRFNSIHLKYFWVKLLIPYVYKFYYLRSRTNYYSRFLNHPFYHKFEAIDLPLYKGNAGIHISNYFDNKLENWCYAGTLSSPHYNPMLLIKFWEKINDPNVRALHIYTRDIASLSRVIEYTRQNSLSVIFHDYVAPDVLCSILNSSDVLLNIKTTSELSSKIFDYMNYKKIIVSINDLNVSSDIQYINQYPLGLVIDANNISQINGFDIVTSIKMLRNLNIPEDYYSFMFNTFTPEFLCKRLLNECNTYL